MGSAQSHYELLGVRHDASPEALHHAYKQAVRASHPDSGPATEREWRERRTVELNVAYSVLKDPLKRADYDERLRALLSPPAAPAAPSDMPTPPSAGAKRRRATASRPAPRSATPLGSLLKALATPGVGWLLVVSAALLGNSLGGPERAIDAFCWAALAHWLLSMSSKSPLPTLLVGGFRLLERLIGR